MKQRLLGHIGAMCALVGFAGSAMAQAPVRPGVANLTPAMGARLGTSIKPKGERISGQSSSLLGGPGAFVVAIFAAAAVTFAVIKISKSGGSNPPASPGG